MHFFKTLLPLALISVPVLAVPTPAEETNSVDAVGPSILESRAADTVTCTPRKNKSKTKTFKVDTALAKSEAHRAGMVKGKSGDPHRYRNGAKKESQKNGHALDFGIPDCNSEDAILWEYPVYWQGSKGKKWQKDTRTDLQENTPIRVVYANKNGGAKYCGVMIHNLVTKELKGSDDFSLCK